MKLFISGMSILFFLITGVHAFTQPRPAADSIRIGMVNIGFHNLFIKYTGDPKAAYTIVFESGGGGSSKDWDKVKERLPKSFRTFVYDRAGLGKSEAGPKPRTMAQEVYELHEALIKAKIKKPFILVGQSIGGLLVQLYAEKYAGEVAGLILLDPTSESGILGSLRYGGLVRLREKASGAVIPTPQLKQPLAIGYDSTADYMAEEFQQIYILRQKQTQPFRKLPLVVIGAGKRNQTPGTTEEQWKELRLERDDQVKQQTNLSANSKFILDANSGHMVHFDNPQLVADAITLVINSLINKSRLEANVYPQANNYPE